MGELTNFPVNDPDFGGGCAGDGITCPSQASRKNWPSWRQLELPASANLDGS